MNERIRELAEQCRFEIQGINCEVLGQGFDEEKFAELIVKECCDIVHRKTDESIRVVMAIEQHFGVEE